METTAPACKRERCYQPQRGRGLPSSTLFIWTISRRTRRKIDEEKFYRQKGETNQSLKGFFPCLFIGFKMTAQAVLVTINRTTSAPPH
jgi:hypothetical protein